jgi:hypothetical protein
MKMSKGKTAIALVIFGAALYFVSPVFGSLLLGFGAGFLIGH